MTFLSQAELAKLYGLRFDLDGFVTDFTHATDNSLRQSFVDLHWTTLSAWSGRPIASRMLSWGAQYETIVFELTSELRNFWNLPPNAVAFVVDIDETGPVSGEALSRHDFDKLLREYSESVD